MTGQPLPADEALIDGLRAGDRHTLETLVARYWSPLCNYAEGIAGTVADPQDVVQDAFIRIWKGRAKLRREGSVRALVYTVTRNAALDELRRSARREAVATEAPRPTAPSPDDDAVASDLERAARTAVSHLPPKRQEIFRLAREEGLTYAEIASVLGLSPQTVANHMSLALADLRRELARYLPNHVAR